MFNKDDKVLVNSDSSKTYGATFPEPGTILEVHVKGYKGFDKPLAIVLFSKVKLEFNGSIVERSLKVSIKLTDLKKVE